jgi:peroxiredoxin
MKIQHALLALLAAFIFTLGTAFAAPAPPETDGSAPAFSLRTIGGDELSLAGLRGTVLVLHFAATWCPFCAAEAPHLEKLYQEYRGRGVTVAIVDIREPAAIVAKNARKLGLTFPIALDPEGDVARSFAPPPEVQPDLARDEVMIASNLIIDRDGRIRFFSLLDSAHFDAKLVALRARLDQLLQDK